MRDLIRLVPLVLLPALPGCRTVKHIPVETVRHDTLWRAKEVRDSIYLRDSVRVEVAGDTVWVTRDRYLYRDRIRTDTVYRSRRDTLSVPVSVEARLTRWQRVKQEVGGFAIGGILLMALAMVGRNFWKRL